MKEKQAASLNGFLGVLIILACAGAGIFSLMQEAIVIAVVLILVAVLLVTGIVIVPPNQAYVVTFFGKYIGTIRANGLFLTIPLTTRQRITLRIRNFNSKTLKVNDIEGNPIEIAAVIVYRVVDTAKAAFNVDDYEEFVAIQSEAAVRHIASNYPYDNFNESGFSLRENGDEITGKLQAELEARLNEAGVEVMEARFTHLAYSTEIAQAMLQRQQAAAIIAARKMIVEGAVGMSMDAVEALNEGDLELDPERKAQMVNNLMVAIVSDRGTQPVVNNGSLY
ncbi:SPFH domain-containing protein [Terribacillus saccharophilus]|uniref:SPFH domain-containing protein n=1 Tax=Terribacillus saccharophilus TaxID=361277 RepID=UPI002DC31115|nr:SPFH domain-containing protein [Terribacillus saccharophilus]MEC0289573.1 SPFH domain-containing protein [Terribacillus saccharophilus]MEC0301387.1 SPFH domain-containing protein [Terribacillus saccharophilus]